MVRRLLAKLPLILWGVLLAALPLRAWLSVASDDDGLDVPNQADGIESITWAGTLRDDGRLAVVITYELTGEQAHQFDIRVPPGARFLAVDGEPLAADVGRYASTRVAGRTIVTYELPGRVTRYRDGAILQLLRVEGGYVDGDHSLFACPRCYIDGLEYGNAPVYGQLFVPGTSTDDLYFLNLDPIRAEADDSGVRFVGVNEGVVDVSMVAVLPSEAVPELPVRDGSVTQALDRVRASVDEADSSLIGPTEHESTDVIIAIVLTTLLGGFLVWAAVRHVWRRGTTAAEQSAMDSDSWTHASAVKPNELSPALAGIVVGDTGPGHQSVVAATILDLIHRGIIEVAGNDTRRFVLHIPTKAIGGNGFERAVLTSLRPINDPTAGTEVAGPPLWGLKASLAERNLRTALAAEARQASLMRPGLTPKVLVPLTVAMGVVAIVGGYTGQGWLTIILGSILAFPAAWLSGLELTAHGRFEREQWIPYAAFLRSRAELERAGPHDVHRYGEQLVYAAALGGASRVAASMSPTAESTSSAIDSDLPGVPT